MISPEDYLVFRRAVTGRPLSRKAVAHLFGTTQGNVRLIEMRALRKLSKHPELLKLFRDLKDDVDWTHRRQRRRA